MKTMNTDPLLLDSPLKTTVMVIGAGGTGSHFVDGLGMMNQALLQLGHNGLHVTVCDDDRVEPHNIGRQLFGWGDTGSNKASAITARLNRMHGTAWVSKKARVGEKLPACNIVVTCVDNGRTRNKVDEWFKLTMASRNPEGTEEHSVAKHLIYWLDIGNDDRYGQFVLASPDLPTCVDRFGKYDESEEGPSCSSNESLLRQDLFINRIMADMALNLLWDLFRRGRTDKCGGFVNLKTGRMMPILIP